MAQALFDRPRPCGLEVAAFEDGEAVLVTLGEVLARVQPEVLRPRQGLVARRDKRPVLLLFTVSTAVVKYFVK